jgi:hypothetical protein
VIPYIRFAIAYSVRHVSAEKMLLKARITQAAAGYKLNNKHPRDMDRGGAHALGPVGRSVGELKPFPVAMERASRPISQPN